MIYLELFLTFLKIGAFTFGGGYAMLPLIQEEVIKNGWLNMQELVDFVAVSESTPGPFAINISTYVGYETGGLLGAFLSTLGVVLPSFIVILLVAKFYVKFRKSNVVNGCMDGLRPAVIGLIGSSVISVGITVFSTAYSIGTYYIIASVVILVVLSAIYYKNKNPIVIILASAVLGIAAGAFI